MVQHGERLLSDALTLAHDVRARIAALPGLHVLHDELIGAEASHDLDPLKIVIDASELHISGYQAADWLRADHSVDVGLSDHRRIEAQLSMADDASTAGLLLDALHGLPEPAPVRLPSPGDREREAVVPPREALFARTEDVAAEKAVGRICAEALDYLRSGLRAGLVLPDPTDPELATIRVMA
jgi:hypothetical protein